MDYKKIFSNRLTEERKAAGKTQEQMAIQIDVSRPAYTTYETGVSLPNFEHLIRIAETLNVSIDYLVGFSDEKRIQK